MPSTGREFKNFIYGQFAKIGKAFACSTRLEIIDLLCQGERTVEVLANEASQTIANTSRHLQILLAAKLVRTHKKGIYVTYQLADQNVGRFWKSMQKLSEGQISGLKNVVHEFFNSDGELEEINHKELFKRVVQEEVIVIDVRPSEEYKAGHIKSAVSIPLKELRNRLGDLPVNKEIIAYCRGPYCVLSHEAVKLLRRKGLKAYRLSDGPLEWEEHNVPVDKNSMAV